MSMMDIRVKTEKQYGSLYEELKNLIVGDMHELFFLCVCLGFREKKKIPFEKKGEDRFYAKTFTSSECNCFYAMMLETHDMDFASIKDDKKVIAEMEQYANGGIVILMEKVLCDYVINKNNEYTLDPTSRRELAKHLLHFIFAEAQ